MTSYIILFRGVGGATQLPTGPLREALAKAGYEGAGTYINSGNAYLRTRKSRASIIKDVAAICSKEFDFRKEIYAVSLQEWDDLIEHNPFPGFQEGKFLHASVLGAEPDPARVAALKELARNGEGIEVVGGVAYLHTPGGLSSSTLGTRFDKGLGVPNTARNWNTVLRLRELAAAL